MLLCFLTVQCFLSYGDSELIEQISVSKARQGSLLGRIRDSYHALFQRLIDNVVLSP